MNISLLQEQLVESISAVFREDATLVDLLSAIIAMATFWFIIFSLLSIILKPVVENNQFIDAAGRRDYENHGKEMAESLGMPVTSDEHVERYKDSFAWIWGIVLQHFVGGMLCLPSVLQLEFVGDEKFRTGLACLGVISEIGWEIEDILTLIYKRYFTPNGKSTVPGALLILMCTHHTLGTGLGLPMILAYRDMKAFHGIVLNLQLGASISIGVGEYTKLLDISKQRQLRQFQNLTAFALVTSVLTRAIHWPFAAYQVLSVWYQERSWVLFAVGSVVTLLFTMFSFVAIIQPYYNRFVKFSRKKAEYEALPDTPETLPSRRSSFLDLQDAALNIVYDLDDDDEDAIINNLASSLVTESSDESAHSVLRQRQPRGGRKSSIIQRRNRRSSIQRISSIIANPRAF